MRIIDRYAFALAKGLTEQMNESHEKRGVYYYGFQIVLGGIVKVTLLAAISLILGAFMPTATLLFFFATLRVLAGGVHMDTYGKCIASSLIMFISCGVLIRYTYMYWSLELVIGFVAATFLIGLLLMLKWAPGDTPNKRITNPAEIKRLKSLSIAYMIVWAALTAVLIYFDLPMYALASTFGVALEAFTITPPGYRLFEGLEKGLNSAKGGGIRG